MEPRAARDLNCKQWEVRPSHGRNRDRRQCADHEPMKARADILMQIIELADQ